jgi:two-component sensor histidine kinase
MVGFFVRNLAVAAFIVIGFLSAVSADPMVPSGGATVNLPPPTIDWWARVGSVIAVVVSILAFVLTRMDKLRERVDAKEAKEPAVDVVLEETADDSDHTLDLASVLDAILKPHQTTSGGDKRFVLLGPTFECNQSAVSSIALVIHELATNAVKYGALSTDTGRVHLSWHSCEGLLNMNWQELGTEPAVEPANIGFGSKLVEAAVRQLRGTIEYHWRPEGLAVALQWPESAVGKFVELQ